MKTQNVLVNKMKFQSMKIPATKIDFFHLNLKIGQTVISERIFEFYEILDSKRIGQTYPG